MDILPSKPKKLIKPTSAPPVDTSAQSVKSATTELNIASEPAPAPTDLPTELNPPAKASTKKRTGIHPIQKFKALSKKKKALVIFIVVLVLAGGTAGAMQLLKKPATTPKPTAQAKIVAPPPPPTTAASPLTGVVVPIDKTKRPVTAIMIENSPDARPQSGLKDSGVIFEAIAEGGITRFLTLHQEDTPDYIGPVRSVRPYYIDWLHAFDAAVAHAGGSTDGLAKIKAEGIKDLDHGANGDAYTRVSSRYAPHNLYTSMAKLDAASQKRGYTSSKFDSFPRKDVKSTTGAPAKTLDFNISGPLYNPHYDYDSATNTYKRSEGGKPHIDEKSGSQLAPTVVIALVMNYGIADNGVNSKYDNIGSGKCYVYQDGLTTEGTWTKTGNAAQITFKDADGKAIALNRGQTWISVVGSADRVTAKP